MTYLERGTGLGDLHSIVFKAQTSPWSSNNDPHDMDEQTEAQEN